MKGPVVLGVPGQKQEGGVFTIKALLGNPYKEANMTMDHHDRTQNKTVTEAE